MNRSHQQLRGLLQAWADWKINGGWSYTAPTETAEGLKIRAPGTHSDPTLARMIGMELGGDCAAAMVDGFVKALPRLRRALVNSTYYDPLVDREPFQLAMVLRDYGISQRVYYDQMRAVMDEFGLFLDEREAQRRAA